MDSASSGSLQTSSGGDEESDSRAQRFPPPFITNPPHLLAPFHPFSTNFFDPLQSNPNSLPSFPDNPIQSRFMPTTTPITDLNDQVHQNTTKPASARNPRKRTRASRRAPTTVLTTDTSNFRAMVQEFTGIPAPPFTPVSPFSRPRFDLFRDGSSTSATPTPPPYLLRPFPQKLSPFLSPSSSSHFLLPKHNPSIPVPNMPVPSFFNFQPNINLLGSNITPTERISNPPPLPEVLLSGNVGGGGGSGSGGGDFIPANWSSGGGGGSGGESASDQGLLRSVNVKYSTDTKLNNDFLGSSSSSNLDFRGDKGSENVTNRTEGMIESWICSSD